jgi:RNA polymerase sigma-70 factor, ECF subfamily
MLKGKPTMTDHWDFEQIAAPHMPRLHNYALKLTMNSEDAKDLTQETYLKAFRFWNKFEKGTNIKAWLYQIMKNSYINQYRAKIKEPKKIEYDEALFYATPQHQPIDFKDQKGEPVDKLFGDEIAQSIKSLPSTFRTIVLLSDVEELTYAEIAKRVACPVGTVRSRLHRGRKILQQQLLNFATINGYVSRKCEDSKHSPKKKFKER